MDDKKLILNKVFATENQETKLLDFREFWNRRISLNLETYKGIEK